MIQADRNRIGLAAAMLAATSLTACLDAPPDEDEDFGETVAEISASNAAERAQLALRWAPVHYQDVDQTGSHSLGGAADYITAYDFDGNLEGRDNWDHAGNAAFPLRGVGYYSVTETSSHWFIVYLFFHPRDWSDFFFESEHENDAEGVLLTVQRDGSTFGQLKSAITVAHTDFFSYIAPGSGWTANAETVDGTLQMQNLGDGAHPVTAQEAKGHGLKARPGYDIVGDGIIYFPTLGTGEVPSNPDDRDVKYQLVDILAPGGMWDQRDNPALFGGFGSFAGDTSGGCGAGVISCGTNSANSPWGWDDSNDGPGRGQMASDPANLASNYFRIPEGMSSAYTFNPFR